MCLTSAPNTCRPTTGRPRRHSKTSYRTCPATSGLLQRRTCWPVFQLQRWHRSSESCTQRHAPFWISSHVTVWFQLFESFTGCQSLRGSSTSCACWFTIRFLDTRRNISQTFWHRLPIFQVDIHCALHRVATSSCRGYVDESATEPFLLLHREHRTGCRRSWNCCDRRTRFVVISKHFGFILSTGTRIGFYGLTLLMRPRSSIGRNTSASVTVTVYFTSL